MSTTTPRTDAIGQELKVNECAYVISKSSSAGGDIGLITKLNPKTVQINGRTTIEDFRVIIVTDNLVNMGKANKVDSLRKNYADKVDLTDPTEKPVKIPIRFILLKEQNGDQHLVRFEGDHPDDARKVINAIPELRNMVSTHSTKLLARKKDWRSQESYVAFTDYWRFGKECVFALRTLPDNIARNVNENEQHIMIPHHDKQPDKVITKK